ncbi:MAG: polymerase, sigma-24 subunit, subfamily [Eubacterium sp.]|jgi:DNA-directed RNA polymerase specialized sigma subunit|nr:polymerase, sigma-24 subunit, subfamily [Eubacterium sp.]
MTKEELRKIKTIGMDIKDYRNRIQDLYNGDAAPGDKYVSDKVTGSSTCFPYSARSFRIEGFEKMSDECIQKRNDLAEKLNKKMEQFILLLNKAYGYFDTIPDRTTRLILIHKFIDNMSEEQIAEEMGISRSTVQRKIKFWREKEKHE